MLDHVVEDVGEGDHSEGPDIPAKCTERDHDLERAKGAGWFASHCGLVRGAATLKTGSCRLQLVTIEDGECEQGRHYLTDDYSRRLLCGCPSSLLPAKLKGSSLRNMAGARAGCPWS